MNDDVFDIIKSALRNDHEVIKNFCKSKEMPEIIYQTHSANSMGAGGYPLTLVLAALILENAKLRMDLDGHRMEVL